MAKRIDKLIFFALFLIGVVFGNLEFDVRQAGPLGRKAVLSVAQTGGADWLRRLALPFVNAVTSSKAGWPADLAAALITQVLMCGLCYCFYRRKIFIRI